MKEGNDVLAEGICYGRRVCKSRFRVFLLPAWDWQLGQQPWAVLVTVDGAGGQP
jgi:hypothetical protein